MVSEPKLAQALIDAGGNQSAAARAVEITHQAVSDRVRKSEKLQEAQEIGLRVLAGESQDVIREALTRRQINTIYVDGKANTEYADVPDKVAVDTAKWALARLDKGRFSERQEITGADGGPVNVNVILDDGS